VGGLSLRTQLHSQFMTSEEKMYKGSRDAAWRRLNNPYNKLLSLRSEV
jgi:hypothetical protein